MALVQSVIVAGYQEGMASKMASDELLNSGVMPVSGQPRVYQGNSVLVSAVGAPAAAPVKNRGSGGGSAPVALSTSTASATVRTMTPAAKLTKTNLRDLERNNGMDETAESLIKANLIESSAATFRSELLTALATTTLEHDISGLSSPDDKIDRDALIAARDKFGDETANILCWFAHSAKISEMEMLINANGVPYFQRDPNSGKLMVLGYPVFPIDTGTLASSVYTTFLVKKGAVHFGREDIEARGESMDGVVKDVYVPDASGAEGYHVYEMDVDFHMHLFAKYPGCSKAGVVKLLSH